MQKMIKQLAFIGLAIAMFMGILDGTIVNIALPGIMTHFNATLSDTSWIVTTYVLALAIFTIVAAKLADQFGRKKFMILGLLLFGGFSAACMFAPSLFVLSIYRFIQGIGAAIMTPIVLPMGVELFGKSKLPLVTAAIGAISVLAAASGPALGGVILQFGSWHWIFAINVPLALLAALLILFFTQESYDETVSRQIDFWGILTLTAALFGITFGLLKGQAYGWQSVTIISSLSIGILMVFVFIFIQKNVKFPMLELDLFKLRAFSSSCLIYLIISFALVCPSLVLNYFLQNVLNYSALTAGLMIAPCSLAVAVAMPLGTKLAAKIGAAPINFTGTLIISASLFLLSLIKTDTPRTIIIVFGILNGIGFGLATQSIVSAMKPLPKSKSGIGSGIVNTGRQLGMCLGIAILVTILDANVDQAKDQIHRQADQIVQHKHLSKHVHRVAQTQIDSLFVTGNNSSDSVISKAKMKKIRSRIQKAAEKNQGLPAPKRGTVLSQLYTASSKLSQGSGRLAKGQQRLSEIVADKRLVPVLSALNTSSQRLHAGQQQFSNALAKLAQAGELQNAMHRIQKIRNRQIERSFAHTYLFASLLMLLCSPIAFFTDTKKTA
ncbi:MAG: DHA2 family efflux MFS transporter permease subunit [Oenococcus sp.]|uniref:DHA2 family efflux MFS transporter permease subunit n=1 Tax=Oenococcus sp. TaxID=1979414 RepID=UPI0039ED0C40